MLVRLFGSNFRSFKDPFELSMVASELSDNEENKRGVIEAPINGMEHPLKLLRTVAIYGANGSGKSTILTAANALRWLVMYSSPKSEPDKPIAPYEPFLLDENSSKSPTTLGCDVVYNSSILRYEIIYTDKKILEEKLELLDQSDSNVLIERLPSGEVKGSLISSKSPNKLYVKEMQPNVAVLSKLAQHGPIKGKGSVQPYFGAISSATKFSDYSNAAQARFSLQDSITERFADDTDYQAWIMNHLIRASDVGICDVKARHQNDKFLQQLRNALPKTIVDLKFPETRVVVNFVHHGIIAREIDFTEESAGTKKLFNLANDWWSLGNSPITLFADELSASLHPRLLDRLIRAVNEPLDNSKKSQLIFTTHDTGLLESQDGLPAALRYDQIYLTKKSYNGCSELYSIAEFQEPSGDYNIRKRYLSGQYGALPIIERLSL
jgi:uncharacterized protein